MSAVTAVYFLESASYHVFWLRLCVVFCRNYLYWSLLFETLPVVPQTILRLEIKGFTRLQYRHRCPYDGQWPRHAYGVHHKIHRDSSWALHFSADVDPPNASCYHFPLRSLSNGVNRSLTMPAAECALASSDARQVVTHPSNDKLSHCSSFLRKPSTRTPHTILSQISWSGVMFSKSQLCASRRSSPMYVVVDSPSFWFRK